VNATTDAPGIAQRQAALEQSHLPRVAEAAADLSRFDSDAEYEFTLNLTLDAVLARLARYSPTADEAGLRRDH